MRTGALILALALALASTGCALLEAPRRAAPTPAMRGHEAAVRLCSACHAVEPGGVSPRPRAAAFASREMQHTAGLEGRVAALTRQGHYGMAPIELSAREVGDIVAYIESLGERGARSSGGSQASRAREFRQAATPAVAQAGEAGLDPAEALTLGRALVVGNCGRCHAVGPSDDSSNPVAPAFRDLSQRYDVEALGESLAEGILTGHPEMPEFRFEPREIDAILRYLQSLQVKQRGAAQSPLAARLGGFSPRRVAAVDYELRAGDELGLVRGQVDAAPGDVVRLADVAEGM